MSEITQRIRSAGYWEVAIHPVTFQENRIRNITDLYSIIQKCAVEIRGWDFPHLDHQQAPVPRLDFIQEESAWQHHSERWRFYQTGQFNLLRGMPYDWRDLSEWWPPDGTWKRGSQLGIGDALFTFVEIYEFAARLSNTPAGDDRMRVVIQVGGIRGRRLAVDDPKRMDFRSQHIAEIDVFPQDQTISRTDLVADTRGLAITSARELFARFGRDMPEDVLRDWLGKLVKS